MATSKLTHTLHAVIYPADDISGQWVAVVLELDIVTQGNSREHAIVMVDDAIRCAAEARLEMGLSPLDFRSAPEEDWERFRQADPTNTHVIQLAGVDFIDEVTVTPHIARAS